MYTDIPVYVTGCPMCIYGNDNELKRLYTGQGKIVDDIKGLSYIDKENEYDCIHYDVDTSGGNSGSPVYTITKNRINNRIIYSYTAIGIHSGDPYGKWNHGPEMSRALIQFYKNNEKANHC